MDNQTTVDAVHITFPFRTNTKRQKHGFIDELLTPRRLLVITVIAIIFFTAWIAVCVLPKRTSPVQSTIPGSGVENRVEIPGLGIEVGLQRKEAGISAQEIVDADDTAVLLSWPGQNAIVDHNTQAFRNLIAATPGKTVAYVTENGEMKAYVCVAVHIGKILDDGGDPPSRIIVDSTGQDVRFANQGGLCLYSCLGKTENGTTAITLTYWQPANSCKELISDVQNLLSDQ